MATPRSLLPVVLLLALVGGAVLARRFLGGPASLPGSNERAVATTGNAADRAALLAAPNAARSHDSDVGGDAPVADEAPLCFPAIRQSGAFVAEIVDRAGAPVAGTEVRIDSWIGGHHPDLAIADDRNIHRTLRANDAGRVAISNLFEGAYSIAARADDGRSARKYFDYTTTQRDQPLRLQLSAEPRHLPGIEVTIVGIDGAIVADAEVELHGAAVDRGRIGGASHPALKAHGDALGVARFDDVRWYRGMAFAHVSDGRVGACVVDDRDSEDSIAANSDLARIIDNSSEQGAGLSEINFMQPSDWQWGMGAVGDDDLEESIGDEFVSAKLVVGPPGKIVGRIDFGEGEVDPDGALAGATIEAWLATAQVPFDASFGRSATAPVEGREFVVEGLPAGKYSLVLHAPGGARLVLDRFRDNSELLENSVAPPLAEVKVGTTTDVTLRATIGGTIHGHVHLADGSPVAGARVVATFGPWRFEPGDAFVRHEMHVWSFGPESGLESLHPLTHVVARTDVRGDYRLVGLQPGLHRVMVTARGLCFDCREWTAVGDGRVVEFDHELEAAGALQGIAPDGGLFGITRVGAARPVAIATLLDRRDCRSFTFSGLRPGTYILADFAEERRTPPVERGRATVEAGHTTFVDLSDAPAPVEITGQVVDANGAVPSAVVEFDSVRRHADGAGGFVFHCSFPDEEGYELSIVTDQFIAGFRCPADASRGGGWRGSLRLGNESLRIEVRDTRSDPLTRTVELWRSNDPPQGDPRDFLRTKRLALDASGALTIDHLRAGRYDLRVSAHGTTLLKTKVDVPHADVLRLDLADSGSLVVHVVDAAGNPAPQWNVVASTYLRDGDIPDDFVGHDEWFTTTNASSGRDGVARLDHVRTGKVVVKAEAVPLFLLEALDEPQIAPTNAPANTPPPVRLDLHPGDQQEIELRLPPPVNSGH